MKRGGRTKSRLREFAAADALPADILLIIETGLLRGALIERTGCELLSRTAAGSDMEMYSAWPREEEEETPRCAASH